MATPRAAISAAAAVAAGGAPATAGAFSAAEAATTAAAEQAKVMQAVAVGLEVTRAVKAAPATTAALITWLRNYVPT